jgi:hypothetical protein
VGARFNRAWTVPLGATLAMPVLWPAALSVLVAVIPLSRSPSAVGHRRAADWALAAGSARSDAPDTTTASSIMERLGPAEAAASVAEIDITP